MPQHNEPDVVNVIVSENSGDEDDNPQILYPPLLDTEANEEFTLAPQAPIAPAQPQESLHYYNPSPMEVLIEMGFENLEQNRNVLSQCEGDINRAVQALLFQSESQQQQRRPQLRPPTHPRQRSDGAFYA